MKYLFFYIPILITLLSCSDNRNPSRQEKNFTPSMPEFTSDRLTPEILWSFGRVGVPQVSPDNKFILYGITYINIAENKSYRDLYLVPVNGGTPKRITNTSGNESDEVWRPDGKKISYLLSLSGEQQLWEMNPDGSSNRQITKIKGGILGFKYAPDLKHIIFIKAVKLDKNIHDLFTDLPLANARLETDLMYRHWDAWHDYTYQHIFVAEYGENGLTGKKT